MRTYGKLFLGLLLILFAVLLFTCGYMPARRAYEQERIALDDSIIALRAQAAEYKRYAGLRAGVPEAAAELDEVRAELYSKFPKELREEDQIMYVLYLEELFGTEIDFDFGTVEEIAVLSDGAVLGGLELTVNYRCGYDDFQNMLRTLAQDDRLTSVRCASMSYNTVSDTVTGTVTLVRYLLDSGALDYTAPDIPVPETGKENIFG